MCDSKKARIVNFGTQENYGGTRTGIDYGHSRCMDYAKPNPGTLVRSELPTSM